jgi:hypothetical protein
VHLTAAGSCTISADQASGGGFSAAQTVSQSFTIQKANLAVGTITVPNKVYDGTVNATIGSVGISGTLYNSDVVTLTGGTATFADKKVGTNKQVTVSGLLLAGASAANYQLTSSTGSAAANITPLGVSASITTSNKPYDGNATATAASSQVIGALAADVVTLAGGTLSFADKTVATSKPVTATGWTLAGTDAPNYALGTVAASAASITATALTGTATASNKVYDGTTDATATATVAGFATGDNVTVMAGSASFNDKNVGAGKVVTVNVTLG